MQGNAEGRQSRGEVMQRGGGAEGKRCRGVAVRMVDVTDGCNAEGGGVEGRLAGGRWCRGKVE